MIANRRLLAGLAAVSAALLLCACGTASAASVASQRKPAVARGGVVLDAEVPGGNPDYIFPVDPGPDQSVYNFADFQPLLYEPLYQLNFNKPSINYANSIGNPPRWIDHDKAVVVTLKHYRWSNGTPVTTRDVTFFVNLARAAGPNWGRYTPGDFPYNLARITVQSAYKMTFYLTQSYNPTYYLENQLSDIVPIPQNVWDRESLTGKVANWELNPVGAKKVWQFLSTYAEKTSTYSRTNRIWGDIDGPFALQSFGGDSAPDIFVPNPTYSGHRASIAKFEEVPFTSNAAEYDDLRSGGQKITIGYIPTADIPTIGQVRSAGYTVYRLNYWAVYFTQLNFANPAVGKILDQLYIRQALQHLTDEPVMIASFLHGYGVPSYGPVPIKPSSSFLTAYEASDPYPYSVEAAERLLASHGWKRQDGVQTCEDPARCGAGIARGTKLSLNMLYASHSGLTLQNELFQSDAAKAGVRITLREESFGTVLGIVSPCTPGKGGITLSSPQCTWQLGDFGGSPEFPEPTGGAFFLPGAALNSGSYNNPELTTLIHEIRRSDSLQPFYDYENLLAKELPWIWEPTPSGAAAVAKNLAGPGITSVFNVLSPNYWYFVK